MRSYVTYDTALPIQHALWGGELRIRPQQSRIKKRDSAMDARSSRYHDVYARWHTSCSSSIGYRCVFSLALGYLTLGEQNLDKLLFHLDAPP